jgi:hypothetical protein
MEALPRGRLVLLCVLAAGGLAECMPRSDDIPCVRDENCPDTRPYCVQWTCSAEGSEPGPIGLEPDAGDSGAAGGDGDAGHPRDAGGPSADAGDAGDVRDAGAAADAGEGGGAGDGGFCRETIATTNVPANLMFVLDQSASMMELTGSGVTKWAAATSAVTRMANTFTAIHLGLTTFPGAGNDCLLSAIQVPIGPDRAGPIQSALPAKAEGAGTPIAGGLHAASMEVGLGDTKRSNGLILITDGNENCGGSPVVEVKALFSRPNMVRTYVIGFGSAINPTGLTNMAIGGGTARTLTPRYYQADNQADLDQALKTISNSAQLCSFTLSRTGLDPAALSVSIDGQLVPRDPSRTSGWDFDPGTSRTTLFGSACEVLANTPTARVEVEYRFPCGVDGGTLLPIEPRG